MCGNWEQDAYTKLENSETGVRVEQSPDEYAMYYLTRAEGQLERVTEALALDMPIRQGRDAAVEYTRQAKLYLVMLRNVLDKDAV